MLIAANERINPSKEPNALREQKGKEGAAESRTMEEGPLIRTESFL